MKVLVGVKQVPKPSEMQFLPGINRIVRETVAVEMNPLDVVALARAVELCDGADDAVVAFTMGPPQARAVLEAALARGADRAVHLVDPRFAGADTLATARALAQLCRRERPDLVLFGRLAIDGGTAQVAPQVAELAGLSLLTEATAVAHDGDRLVVRRDGGRGQERWSVPLPAVISLDRPSDDRVVTGRNALDRSREHSSDGIDVLDVDALGGDESGYGIRGSATYVQRIDPVDERHPGLVITDAPSAAKVLLAAIDPESGITRRELPGTLIDAPVDATSATPPRDKEVWAVAERDAARHLHRLSAEAIACASPAARALGAAVVAVVLGDADDATCRRLGAFGADRILVVRSPELDASGRATDAEVAALSALVGGRAPLAVVGPWTQRGRQYMPRVAARLGIGLTGDVIGLDTSPRPGGEDTIDLAWLKPAWSGTVLARVVARTACSMGTLRPGAVAPLPERDGSGAAVEVVDAAIPPAGAAAPQLVGESDPDPTLGPEVASVLLCVGPDAAPVLPALRALADERGWVVGGTAGAVAAGLVPPRFEVGLERWALSPQVAIAVWVDCASAVAALRGARTIVTVDPDIDARVHAVGDIAIACDLEVLAAHVRAMATGSARRGGGHPVTA